MKLLLPELLGNFPHPFVDIALKDPPSKNKMEKMNPTTSVIAELGKLLSKQYKIQKRFGPK